MKSRTKRAIWIAVLITVLAGGFAVLRSYLFNRIKLKIENQLALLHKSGYHVSYDSIYIDWKRNHITVDQLLIKKESKDTTSCNAPEFVSAQKVSVNGFRLFPLIFRHELSFKSVVVDKPHVVLRKHSAWQIDSASRKEHEFTLNIDQLHLSEVHFEYADTACHPIADLTTDLAISMLNMDFHVDRSLTIAMNELRIDSSSLQLPSKLYAIAFRGAKFNFAQHVANIDTVRIKPMYSKMDFAHKKGEQIDRIEGVIPFVHFAGLHFHFPDTIAAKASLVELQIMFSIFRDKRVHRIPHPVMLPVDQLRKLAFGLTLDTLRLQKSQIVYEEFPEKGPASGKVTFEQLEATILHVSNDTRERTGETTMDARAAFMGQGELHIKTKFPWKDTKNCLLEGALLNFKLATINPMLEPLAKIQVEDGVMDSLAFQFAYNNTRSDGKIKLTYHNLKLVALKNDEELDKALAKKHNADKDPDELKKNNLKTFILNAFLIRKDMDHEIPEEKRTGTVLFYRDHSRSVFNYWWKSLQSGIKSAFNLDKLQAIKTKKEIRHDKREERKKARADKRAKRKQKKQQDI